MAKMNVLATQELLIHHLEEGGKITDTTSRKYLIDMIKASFRDPDIMKVVRYHNLSIDDIGVFIIAGIVELEPDTTVLIDERKVLVSTIILLDWRSLDNAFALIKEQTRGETPEQRRKSIMNFSASCMNELKGALERL
jgi:hypothetical protein